MKIKVILLTLVVILMTFSCISCNKNREYDENEVILAAQNLIKKSEILNDIYYGNGIAYEKNDSLAEGAYYPANVIHLKEFEISTIDELKKITKECFTNGFSESIFSTKLSSISDEDGIRCYARYYQKYSVLDNTPECIMVYKDANVDLKDKVFYDYSTLKVEGSEGDYVYVTINIHITNPEGKMQNQDLRIALLEEEGGWRIDSPTYARYIDEKFLEEFKK